MRRLRDAAVRVRREVSLRLRLAQLLQADRRRGDRRADRLHARHGARRGALQPLRRAPRPRLRGRPARQDRIALLHQLGCVKLRVPTRRQISAAVANPDSRQPRPGALQR
ncbi:protein of unknown function [Burkholderia multivorans]